MLPDAKTRREALIYLWCSVTHQESIYTVTAPVAELIARMLTDPRLATLEVPNHRRSMREELLSFLRCVAVWASFYQASPGMVAFVSRDDAEVSVFDVFDEPEENPEYVIVGRLGAGCARRATAVISALIPWLDPPDPNEREAALTAVACWAAIPDGDRPIAKPAVEYLRRVAHDHTRDTRIRVNCVLGLVGAGENTVDLLNDPSAMVRTCAALSPTVAADPRTLR